MIDSLYTTCYDAHTSLVSSTDLHSVTYQMIIFGEEYAKELVQFLENKDNTENVTWAYMGKESMHQVTCIIKKGNN